MNSIFWSKVITKMIFGFWSSKKKDPMVSDILEFLVTHPDRMYILESKKGALVYYPPNREVILVSGDFDGNSYWCNFELQRRLHEMAEES